MEVAGLQGEAEIVAAKLNSVITATLKNAGAHLQWHCLQVNVDTVSDWHRDFCNYGNSALFGLGEFSGGELVLEDESKVGVRGRLVIFDAKRCHKIAAYTGGRVAVAVYQSPYRHEIPKKIAGRRS